MNTPASISLLTYPARPLNGGPLDKSRPKRGIWWAEPKYNGWRALVHVPTGTMWNRKGEKLSIAGEFAVALGFLESWWRPFQNGPTEWLDCEALERRHGIGRGSLIILDLPDAAKLPYHWRRKWMETLRERGIGAPFRAAQFQPNSVYYTPAIDPEDGTPEWLYSRLADENKAAGCEFYEGIVMKRADSLYPVQLRSPDELCTAWVKHRWHF